MSKSFAVAMLAVMDDPLFRLAVFKQKYMPRVLKHGGGAGKHDRVTLGVETVEAPTGGVRAYGGADGWRALPGGADDGGGGRTREARVRARMIERSDKSIFSPTGGVLPVERPKQDCISA